jgi:hypothetical protein
MLVTAHNVTDSPIVVTPEGHSLGGGEWGTVEDTYDPVIDAVGRGAIHLFPQGIEAGPGQNPDAVAADQRTKALQVEASAPPAEDGTESPPGSISSQLPNPESGAAAPTEAS